MAEQTFVVRLTKAELWEASQAVEAIWTSDRNQACQSAADKLATAYGKAKLAPYKSYSNAAKAVRNMRRFNSPMKPLGIAHIRGSKRNVEFQRWLRDNSQ